MMSFSVVNPVVHVFPLISLFGVYVVSTLMMTSGHAQAFVDSQEAPFRLLPDGKTLVQTSYTGFGPLDSYLANLQLIFIPLVDGSSPELSLLGWHWAGLLLAVFPVMLVESLRTRCTRDLIFFVFWGLAIQYCGYFVTMPAYCYTHLLRSTKTRSATTASKAFATSAIRAVPISMLLGFVLPSIAMCFPWIHSGKSRQLAVAFWQNFPVWIAAVQMTLTWWVSRRSTLESEQRKVNTQSPATSSQKSSVLLTETRSIRHVYKVTAVISALVHVSGLVLTMLATVRPEILPSLFPLLINETNLRLLQPDMFFSPPRWDSHVQISGMAEGAWNFLRYDYYIGTVAALLWAVILQSPLQNVTQKQNLVTGESNWSWSVGVARVFMIATSTLLLGPGFTLAYLMIRRENHLL